MRDLLFTSSDGRTLNGSPSQQLSCFLTFAPMNEPQGSKYGTESELSIKSEPAQPQKQCITCFCIVVSSRIYGRCELQSSLGQSDDPERSTIKLPCYIRRLGSFLPKLWQNSTFDGWVITMRNSLRVLHALQDIFVILSQVLERVVLFLDLE